VSRRHRVVAAIDFGTYGSGFAWATVNRENDDLFDRKINYFFQWKDQRTVYAKNRTALLIDEDGELVAWGHEAFRLRNSGSGRKRRLHSGFKMDLQPDLGDGLRADDAPRARTRDKDEAYQLIVMCLREVFRAACADIVQGLYRESDIRWCVTVPAIWDSFATDLMYQAAVEAGLPDDPDRLLLAREPAAAALYCVAVGEERLREVGTRFMVVDAGGGTVDIASYSVQQAGRVRGLTSPDGTKSGSEFLNRKFMERELSRELSPNRLIWLNIHHKSELAAVMDSFEQEKLSFDVDSRDGLRLDLGGTIHQALLARWQEDQRDPKPSRVLSFERPVIADLFEEMLAGVLPKVDAQLEAMRAASGRSGGELIVLVGGFAQSPYLRSRLREHAQRFGVGLLVPPRPELAVLSGAVHFAYQPEAFLSWPSPLTYGVRYSAEFRPGIDPENSKVENKDGSFWCRDRFGTLVSVGQQLSAGTTKTRRYAPLNEEMQTLTIRLLTSERPGVVFASEPGVEEAGQLIVDLASTAGRPVKERVVEITLKFHQTRIVATARSVHSGHEASAEIKWRPTW
jgi:hypothetical protein